MNSPHVVVGLNTNTVSLLYVGGDENGTECWGYNWVTLLLEDINMGAGPPGVAKLLLIGHSLL
jgi:hypothetical protein